MDIKKLEEANDFTISILTQKNDFKDIYSFRFWELKNKFWIQKSEQNGAYIISVKN